MSLGRSNTPLEADLSPQNNKLFEADKDLNSPLVDLTEPDFNSAFANANGESDLQLAAVDSGFRGFDVRNIFENFEGFDKPENKEVDLAKYENKAYEAYAEALGKVSQENAPFGEKYMVLLVTRENCGFCENKKNMLKEIGGSIGDKAVFSVSDPTKSPGAKDIVNALEEDRVPVTYVFASNRDTLYVTGKYVGQPDSSEEYAAFLKKSTEKPMSAYGKPNSNEGVALA